jgi:formylglycine-generating enzyme required for sulfatase activity/Tfp pilus assembly protein PilF
MLSPGDQAGAAAAGARPEACQETLGPPAPGNVPPARAIVPGYYILDVLGHGGMGVVYKAVQLSLRRVVALKMIVAGSHSSPEQMVRFRSEAEAVAQLQHTNIVQVHEVGEHEGQPYFSLEYVGGGSLATRLAGSPQPPRQAAAMAETLARAMHFAHRHGIVHRDLKPGNVLLEEDGTPKITDFGLAKRLEGDSAQTRSGAILGTPSYMAPEQAAGRAKAVGPPADVYALGAILYEMLTGRPPFKAETAMDTIMQVVSEEPVAPSRLNRKVPRDLETICLKCLQKEPRKRYAGALDLAEDLHRFLEGESIMGRRAPLWERGVKWSRRHPALATLAAFLCLAALGLAGLSRWVERERFLQAQDLVDQGVAQLDQASAAADPTEADRQYDEAAQSFTRALAIDARNSRASAGQRKLYVERCRRALDRGNFGVARGLVMRLKELDIDGSRDDVVALERRAVGTGTWKVDTQPPGCRATLIPLDADLQPGQPEEVGMTPLPPRDIPLGSYLVLLHHPDYPEVRYPMRIERNENKTVSVELMPKERIPEGMVYVPAGDFLFGDAELGTARTAFVKGFFIDRTEVTGEQYEKYVLATGAATPESWGISDTCPPALRDQAVWNISWFQAVEYARWAGKRLPTEAEWEKAARGADGRAYPWGNHYQPRRSNSRDNHVRVGMKVGQFPQGASPYGCLDMAGNVWEWTLDREEPYSPQRVMRGGANYSTPDDLLVYRRQAAPTGGSTHGALNHTGLRCVVPVEPEEPRDVMDLLVYLDDYTEAAELFWELRQYDRVRQCAERILKLNPRSVAGNYWWAACLDTQGDTRGALEAMKVVYYQNPKYRYLQRDLMDHLQVLEKGPKDFAHCLTQISGVLASAPQGPLHAAAASTLGPPPPRKMDRRFLQVPRFFQEARVALADKDYEAAEESLKKVLAFDPENALAHEQLGLICEATGRADEAAEHYRKRIDAYRAELKEDPGNADLCNSFAWFLAERHLYLDEALALARRAVELEPDNAACVDTLAELVFQNGQVAEAVRLEKQAIELDGKQEEYPKRLKKFEEMLQSK